MSRVFSGGQYLSKTVEDLGITSYPCTIFCYVKPTNFNATGVLSRLYNTVSNYIGAQILLTSGVVEGYNSQSSFNTIETINGLSTGTWEPVVCTFNAASTHIIIDDDDVEGVISQTWQTNSNPSVYIGSTSSGGATFVGKIAHYVVWNVELSPANIALLLAGEDPATVDAANQKRYWKFIDSSLVDEITGTVTLSNTGTTTDNGDNPIITGATVTTQTGAIDLNFTVTASQGKIS